MYFDDSSKRYFIFIEDDVCDELGNVPIDIMTSLLISEKIEINKERTLIQFKRVSEQILQVFISKRDFNGSYSIDIESREMKEFGEICESKKIITLYVMETEIKEKYEDGLQNITVGYLKGEN